MNLLITRIWFRFLVPAEPNRSSEHDHRHRRIHVPTAPVLRQKNAVHDQEVDQQFKKRRYQRSVYVCIR